MNEQITDLPHVVVFSGNDIVSKTFAKKRAVSALQAAFQGLVIEYFNQADETFGDSLQNLLTPTLFGDVRLFIVNHTESLRDADLEELDRVMSNLPDDVYLLIDIDTPGGVRSGKKTDTAGKIHAAERCKKDPQQCIFRKFQKPPDYRMAQWLVDNIKMFCGRSISKDAADCLIDLVGYDGAVLFSEVQKIDLHLDEGKEIDREAVKHTAGAVRRMTVFELAEACGARQGARVLQVLDSLFSTTCSVPYIVSILYRHYGALFRIRQYARTRPRDVRLLISGKGGYQSKNEAAFRIGRAAGLLREGDERKVYPVIIRPDIVPQAQRYTDLELRTILAWLLEFDVDIKTGRKSGSRRDVEMICLKLLRVSSLCGETGGE